MKIVFQKLSIANKTAIVDCLREVGGQIRPTDSILLHRYMELAREIEHGELFLARYNYPKQEKEEQP